MTALTIVSKIEKLEICRGSSLVERRPEKAGVASSILAPGTRICFLFAMYTDIVCSRAHKSRGIAASSSRTGIASPVFVKSMHLGVVCVADVRAHMT